MLFLALWYNLTLNNFIIELKYILIATNFYFKILEFKNLTHEGFMVLTIFLIANLTR